MAHRIAQFYALVFRFSPRIAVPGFDARVAWSNREERAIAQTKVGEALALIARYAPARLMCLRRDVVRIYVGPADTAGAWVRDSRMCVLGFDYVQRATTTAADVALTLIHEGMHARLERVGFGYSESVRARVEALCAQAEAIVARRLPDGEALAAGAERRARRDPAYWTNASIRARSRAQLEELTGASKVVARLASLVARF